MSGTAAMLQAITAILVVVLTLGGAAFAWYVRRHVLGEIKKNSQFRRYASGTAQTGDEGELGELRGLFEELETLDKRLEEQHSEVSRQVNYVVRYCERIADAVDQDVERPPREWEKEGR